MKATLRTTLLATSAAVGALFLSNCAAPTGPNTQRGALTGGAIGAVGGAIIGNQSGRALEGAAVGAAVGAGTGAVIGNSQDEQNRRYYRTRY